MNRLIYNVDNFTVIVCNLLNRLWNAFVWGRPNILRNVIFDQRAVVLDTVNNCKIKYS